MERARRQHPWEGLERPGFCPKHDLAFSSFILTNSRTVDLVQTMGVIQKVRTYDSKHAEHSGSLSAAGLLLWSELLVASGLKRAV